MALTANVDPNAVATAGVLDNVLGTVGSFVDLWGKWETQKTTNQAAKASIPVTQPASVTSAGGVFNQKVVLWALAGAAVIVGLFLFLRRK